MDIAALVVWILAAGGGSYLLVTWLAKGGTQRGGAASKFPPPVIFGHFLLAAAGLVLWIIYVAAGGKGIGWAAFVVLVGVALLGFTMFALWVPTYRTAAAPVVPPRPSPNARTLVANRDVAERHFPLAVVVGHGLFAAATLTLVLLAMLGVG